MKGDVKIGGHTLRVTIGALEDVSEESLSPAVILNALAVNIYTTAELVAVIAAGLKGAQDDADARGLIDDVGIQAARDAALSALTAAFGDALGNAEAVEKTKEEAPAS